MASAQKKRSRRQRYERRLRHLLTEIQQVDTLIYDAHSNDIEQKYFMLERKRDDIVRSAVLQIHTATEDLLDIWLKSVLLGVPARARNTEARRYRVAARAINDSLRSIGFENKLRLLQGLRLLKKPTYDRLIELNRIRNKCSHNWLLKAHIRRGIKPHMPKRPLLQFQGNDLHQLTGLRRFVEVYGPLYVRLFMRVYF